MAKQMEARPNGGAGCETPRNSSARHNIKIVAAAALERAEAVVAHWLLDGKRQGPEWLSLNPTRGDSRTGSFSVNLTTGRWADFATDDKGGDLVALVAYLESKSQGEAANLLGRFLGLTPTETGPAPRKQARKPSAKPTPQPVNPIPPEALDTRPQAHPRLGAPSAIWTYNDSEGRPLAFVYRFEIKDKAGNPDKTFRPCAYWPERPTDDGGAKPEGWDWLNLPAPRPLYRLNTLHANPDAAVLISEGEKAADAAAELLPSMVVTTTMNGAQSPEKSDFNPLKGRRIFIWPDADSAGTKYGEAVAILAYRAGARSVSVLDLASLAAGPPHE